MEKNTRAHYLSSALGGGVANGKEIWILGVRGAERRHHLFQVAQWEIGHLITAAESYRKMMLECCSTCGEG